MADMDKILEIAKRHNLYIIEDCAQSHFSKYHDRLAGTMGIAGTFSFYPGKNLGAYGDAGVIVTDDDELADKCRMFANHGQKTKHLHLIEGINSRLDGLQAAVLSVKLKRIHTWNALRNSCAMKYNELLTGINKIKTPQVRSETEHTFHIYAIRTLFRDQLMRHLAERNIESSIHYPSALPFMPAYAYLGLDYSNYPNAKSHQKEELSLPIFPELSDETICYIVDSIKSYFNKRHNYRL